MKPKRIISVLVIFSIASVGVALIGCAPSHRHDTAWDRAESATTKTADVIRGIDLAKEVAAANLRGADMIGFKASRCKVGQNGSTDVVLHFTQGRLDETHRKLDNAIQGDGLFKISPRVDGEECVYTRNGSLFVNAEGELIVAVGDGWRLEPAITVPTDADEITIGQSGVVQFKLPGDTKLREAGQFELVRFANPEYLKQIGGGLYKPTARSGSPVPVKPGDDHAGVIMQGFLEASNVEVPRENLRIDFLNEWRDGLLKR